MKWNRVLILICTIFLAAAYMLIISGSVHATITSPETSTDTGHQLHLPFISLQGEVAPPEPVLSPRIVTQPDHAAVIAPSSVTLTIEAIGENTLYYQWRRDGQNIAGANGNTYTLQPTMLTDHGSEFDVVVTNAYGSVISEKAILTVTTNMPPTAVNDTYTVTLGGTIMQPPPGVLANDQGDNLQAILEDGVLNGSLSLNADGSFTYNHSGSPYVNLELDPGNSNSTIEYGVATAIDGDTLVVGSNGPEVSVGNYAGAAYVFVRNGAHWQLDAKLVPNDPTAIQFFGWEVDISDETIVVGAPGDSEQNLQYAGAAYIFVRNNQGEWIQQAKLTASDAGAGDEFGGDVAIDGNTVIIGAYFNDHSGETNPGAAYVFTRSGTSWSQEAKLIASDPERNAAFGLGVSIDANTVAVGAFDKNENNLINPGVVYIFNRNGTSWSETAKLTASDLAAGQTFGFATALQNNTLVVGANAYQSDSDVSGAVYIFEYDGNNWQETQILKPANSTNNKLFRYGISVAIDDNKILVGSHAPGSNPDAGAVYHYIYDGNSWVEENILLSLNPNPDEEFGSHVAISGNYIALGANSQKYNPDKPDDTDGKAYVYQIGGSLTDSFTYVANDGDSNSNIATVFIYLSSPTGTPME